MREVALDYMEQRFGIPKKVFSEYSFFSKGEKIWIFSKGILEKNLRGLRIEAKGLLFGRYFEKQKRFKPTTNILQIFGIYANRNVVEISEEEKKRYIKGFDLEKELEIDEGYVILKFREDILGCGLYRGKRIKNQIPKARVINYL